MKTFGQVDHERKVYHCVLDGFANPEQKEAILTGFTKTLESLDASEYSLVFDCRKLATFLPELLPILESYYRFYMTLGFKKVIIINPLHAPSAMQLKRVAKKVDFHPVFVQTEEEIPYYLAS